MGHSSSNDITSNYIGAYPLEKMLEYNWYLLNEKPAENHTTDKLQAIRELMKDMSEEERKVLLSSL